jgi:Dyp-type peroxidase family
MSLDLSQAGIGPNDPTFQPLLNDLQGNILKFHGRDWTAQILLRFKAGQAELARAWVRQFATSSVTTARRQEDQAAAFRSSGSPSRGGLFANFFLSARGYLTLGFPFDRIPQDPQTRFNEGMAARQGALRDPALTSWQEEFQKPVDAMALLASDDRGELEQAVKACRESLAGIADAAWVESGSRWRNAAGLDIEPFGYVDGVSQPQFFRKGIDMARAQGVDQWAPSAPLDLILATDPNGSGEHSCGSFLVYRKLEQDVPGFQQQIEALATTLGTTPELAGAFAVGRFRDGTPVVLQDHPSGANPPTNNFTYTSDVNGNACPFHAHTRKVNPRGDTGTHLDPGIPLGEERGHRIARRSTNFGRPEDIGTAPVGLHFLCFQGDIAHQFEFMQIAWANQVHFIEQQTGSDALIGQGNNLPIGQRWPRAWGDPEAGSSRVQLSSFVTLRGGDYFFAPSVGFLKRLGLDSPFS